MDFSNLMAKSQDENLQLTMECAEMMEKYLSRFPAEKGCISFSGEDKKRWDSTFFPKLVESGVIVDYQFFDARNKGVGVGSDGAFTALEYFHIMYRLYKKLYDMGGMK